MIKYAIPAILVATVMVAGMFAFIPVEQASTVHTTIQGSQAQMQQGEDDTDRISGGAAEASTVTIGTNNNTPFIVHSIIVCGTSDDGTGDDGDDEIDLTGGITVDGDLLTDTAGDPLADIAILADGDNTDTGCIDALEAWANGNAGIIGNTIASNGADMVFTVTFGDAVDQLDSVKVIAFVDGSSTLTVVSGAPG